MTSFVNTILAQSAIADIYDGERTPTDILAHATSEVGELADEVIIDAGRSKKSPGADGIIGEGVDAIICILDLMRKHCPDLSEAELIGIAQVKCKKWIDNLKGDNL